MRRGNRIWEIRKESGGNESKGIKRVEERTHKRKEKEYKTTHEGAIVLGGSMRDAMGNMTPPRIRADNR